jgi:putative flippase GtrA
MFFKRNNAQGSSGGSISMFFHFVQESLCLPARNCSVAAQSVRQALSGSLATLVDLSSFQLILWLGVNIFLSAFFSFILALLTNFFIGRNYVFASTGKHEHTCFKQFIVYSFSAIITLGVIQLFLLVFTVYLMFPPILAKILALPPVFVFTLLSGRFLVFRTRHDNDVKTNTNE